MLNQSRQNNELTEHSDYKNCTAWILKNNKIKTADKGTLTNKSHFKNENTKIADFIRTMK